VTLFLRRSRHIPATLLVVLAAPLLYLTSPLVARGQFNLASKPAAGSSADAGKIPAQWAKTLQAKQIDQLAALYTPDAVFLKPSGERITGLPAIRDLCKKIMDTFSSEFTFHSLASDVSGNLAYDSGEYTESLVKISDKTKAEVQGNYLMIFKRQPDGNWRIAHQMWTLVTPGTE
jgi:uncharacterized protein (TIGR02246 family)